MREFDQPSYITNSPSVTETVSNGSILRTYRWETPDGRKIFLYATFTLKQRANGASYFLVSSNFDSSEVRGQGVHLGAFLLAELERIAKEGLNPSLPPIPLLQQESPNAYSKYLLENNPLYTEKDGQYYRLFSAD